MDVKHIHESVEHIAGYICKVTAKPMEEIDEKELGEAADILKDLTQAEYYARISKAMKEAEEEDERMEHEGKRYYRGRQRDSRGRFMYTEPPYMHRMDDWDAMGGMEDMRDMDMYKGRMYYTDGNRSGSGMSNNSNRSASPGRSSSRYGYSYDEMMDAKRYYSPDDPKGKMERERKHKEWQDDLMDSVENVMDSSTPEERMQLKQSLLKAASKIQ